MDTKTTKRVIRFSAIFPVLCAAVMTPNDAVARKRPNIVFILIDDLGWSDVGYNGSQAYKRRTSIDLHNRAWSSLTSIPADRSVRRRGRRS